MDIQSSIKTLTSAAVAYIIFESKNFIADYCRMANKVIMMLLLLVHIGIVLVYATECRANDVPIKSCCCLGYNNIYFKFNAKSSGVYTIGNFCGVKCSNTRVYCDTTSYSGGGGWLVI